MNKLIMKEFKYAVKSIEYWFGFILITTSCFFTAIRSLNELGIMSNVNIGTAEFFLSCLQCNTLLQISAPILTIFVSMYSAGIINKAEKNEKSISRQNIFSRMISTIMISYSVFFFSYLILLFTGIIFFPQSTGNISFLIGPFKDAYYKYPISIIPITMIHSFVFVSSYALLGMGIGVNLKNNKILSILIPGVFYICFQFVPYILPTYLHEKVLWIVPMLSFDIDGFGVSLLKNATEIIFVLIVGLTLITIYCIKKKIKKYVN